MSLTETRSEFVARFDRIWAQARRVQLSQALCWAVLTALAGIALLAALDYWWELPRVFRIAALIAIGLTSGAVAVWLAVVSVRRWRRQATAAAIEQIFPQLGQRIRTTVQYGPLTSGEIEEAGVATTLVAALEDDTVRRALPLPLDAVIPWRSLALASLLAALVAGALAGASALDWQWRAAARRAFLGNEPYTKIRVKPGDLIVHEGESADVYVTIEGRTGKGISFWTRHSDEPETKWESVTLPPDDAEQIGHRQIQFVVPLERVRHPLEYRVAAGSTFSETYRVKVLYPLKIIKIQSTVRAPEYTGLSESVMDNGNLTGLIGSQAKLQIELDREPQVAWLERQGMKRRPPGEPAERLPLAIEGVMLTATLELATDQTYTIVAKASDGMELPENKFRIRVRKDEGPQVWFESPAEALEVHTLAEILMRVRISDDFGLSRAGIMFEVNNEEEYPLVGQDFVEAASELQSTGKLSPMTRAMLEKVLPLEHFELSQQDSVMYYAFAEDNRPGAAQRTESDLRFIDIRPFRRQYRVVDSDDGTPMNQGPRLKTLEELIARQRYALNRTIQLSRRFKHTGQADLAGVDSLIKFEAELAKSTRELAEGLEARGIDETELLFQAEAAMLGATDSLSASKYDTATLQQRDALKYLIEGRNRLQLFIEKNPKRQLLAQLRQFDRLQQQKLRRPKTDEQEAREVAERLEELADREDFIYRSLAGIDTTGKAKEENQPAKSSARSTEPTKQPDESPTGKSTGDDDKQAGEAGTEQSDKVGQQDVPKELDPASAASLQDLEDRQLDIALEAREIEKILGRLKGVTDLAKERMMAGAKAAEDAAAALGQRQLPDAQGSAESAGKLFRELSQQARALLAQEQAERIAAAQRMAAELARQQVDFVDRLSGAESQAGGMAQTMKKDDNDNPGVGDDRKPSDDPPMAGLGSQAHQIAQKAQTLNDVLGAVSKATDPQDQASAQKVEQIVGSLQLSELIQRLQELPLQVSSGELQAARATADDGAERLEAAAEQLAVLHRSIVAPQVDELAKLEEKLTVLDEQLDWLDTPSAITAWHVQASDLLEELDKPGLSDQWRKEFLEEMKKAGWGPELRVGGWHWSRLDGGYYAAPAPYRPLIARILVAIRGRMQEIMLGEQAFSRDEPIPPQYQELVDRYYQVLASEGKESALPRGKRENDNQ